MVVFRRPNIHHWVWKPFRIMWLIWTNWLLIHWACAGRWNAEGDPEWDGGGQVCHHLFGWERCFTTVWRSGVCRVSYPRYVGNTGFKVCKTCHRSDSNQGSDYIVILLSLISLFWGQHLDIQNVQTVENLYLYPTEDLDLDHTVQEIFYFKILPF